jgi:hypothetical protein
VFSLIKRCDNFSLTEFGQHGKDVITIEELVKHEAGELRKRETHSTNVKSIVHIKLY